MKKIIKHCPMTGRLIVTRGYSTYKIWGDMNIFGLKNYLFTIKIMKEERNRLQIKVVVFCWLRFYFFICFGFNMSREWVLRKV